MHASVTIPAEIEAGNTKAEAEELRAARRRIRLLEQENRERSPPPRRGLPVPGEPSEKMMYPLESELAGHGIPVAVSLRVLRLARQPYYRWLRNPGGETELEVAHRANALHAAHQAEPEFRYRLLRDEAEAAGEPVATRTAWRLCRQNGWHSTVGTRRGKNGRKPGPPGHDDHVKRQFTATASNRLWLTDITEHPTG